MSHEKIVGKVDPPIIFKSINGDNPPTEGEGLRMALYQPGERHVGNREAMNKNLEILENGVKLAADQNAQVVAVGELFLCGYSLADDEVKDVAIELNDPLLKEVGKMALDNNIAIVCPFAEKAPNPGDEKPTHYEALAVYDNKGELIHHYRKNHLWGKGESAKWAYPYVDNPEDAYKVFTINGMKIGVLICYEIEFPEMVRIYATKGVNVMIVPTACLVGEKKEIDKDGNEKWTDWGCNDISKNLIPAHAYFNQIFVAYVNHALWEYKDGKLNGVYMGNSSVGDPQGRILAASDNVETLLVVDCIPKNYPPTQVHNEAQYIKDRRPSLYNHLIAKKVVNPDGEVIIYPDDPNNP
jgi:5-aminopentanamidase